MSDAATWQSSNARYLSAAIVWVRALLDRARREAQHASTPASIVVTPAPAPPPETPAAATASQAEAKSLWRRIRRDVPHQLAAAPQPLLLPPSTAAPGPDKTSGANVDQAAAEMDAAAKTSPPPALILLGQRLDLSPFEQNLLLLCAAMEMDTGIASMCGAAQGDASRSYPTFALAMTIFGDAAWDALSPERPLRYWRLIEIHQPGTLPLTVSPLRADERVASYIKGLNYLDDRLEPLLTPLARPAANEQLPPSQQATVAHVAGYLKQLAAGERLPAVQLLGTDSASKQLVAAHAAAELGLRVHRLPAGLLPAQTADLESTARLWQRESLLLPLALYVDGLDAEPSPAGPSAALRFLSRVDGVVFLDAREALQGLGAATLPVDVAKPTPGEQKAIWQTLLGDKAGDSPALLTSQFNLNQADIERIAEVTPAEPEATHRDRIWDVCLKETRPRLDNLAQRIESNANWEDLVLPAAELDQLRRIAAQVEQRNLVYEEWGFSKKMSRGLGISALFWGESGTGKTMAAEVLANGLHLDLYRIDLSAVVSKYIGETEKNLRRLFDAAEDGGAILFFDEADALFGKRSEVKDAHDRYANIEINYLLQRMEAYRGLAILATNMKNALDAAFLRRLRFVLNFPFPSAAERKAIWQKVFPAGAPTKDLDFDRLAALNMTGGNINSVALQAAFQAARQGAPVTTDLVLGAARAELKKLGRVINELQLRALGRKGSAA